MKETEIVGPVSWDEFPGHPPAVARIRRMILLDRLPHALLFSGPSGIGKRAVAEFLAARLLQTAPEKLAAHPDFYCLSPVGANIKIDQVRVFQRLSGLSPVLGQHRVCIIDPADCMEAPAANCLLKILEEPPEGLVFILITAFPHALLTTIRSRAATIRFFPPDGLSSQDQDTLACRSQAMEFLKNVGKPHLEWLWPVLAPLDELENSRILAIIRQWIFLLRDVGVLLTDGRADAVTPTYNPDLRAELLLLTKGWDIARLASAIKLAEEVRRHLQRNANSRLMLESLLIRSADLYWGGLSNADHRGSPV